MHAQCQRTTRPATRAQDVENMPEPARMAYLPLIYMAAAAAEIAGCFGFWAWLRLGRSAWWLAPAFVSLALFAYLLTLVDTPTAGRAFAAYGGIYIVASLAWMWL